MSGRVLEEISGGIAARTLVGDPAGILKKNPRRIAAFPKESKLEFMQIPQQKILQQSQLQLLEEFQEEFLEIYQEEFLK